MDIIEEINFLFTTNDVYEFEQVSNLNIETEITLDVIKDEDAEKLFIRHTSVYNAVRNVIYSYAQAILIGDYWLCTYKSGHIGFFLLHKDTASSSVQMQRQEPGSFHPMSAWNIPECVDKYYDIACDVYGEENVLKHPSNLMAIPNKGTKDCLTIRVKDVIVENKYRVKMSIPEIFISFGFFSNGNIKPSLNGFRASYTTLESNHSMTHPHLHPNRLCLPQSFCLGGEEATIIRAFNACYEIPDDDNIYNLFFTTNAFLAYEDLDTVPHMRMGTLLDTYRFNRLDSWEVIELVNEDHIDIFFDVDGIDLDIKFDQIITEGAITTYVIGDRNYKRSSNIYEHKAKDEEPAFIFNDTMINTSIVVGDPLILDDVRTSSNGGLNLNNYTRMSVINYFKSKLLKEIQYELEPTSNTEKISETLIGLKKVSRRASNNSFLSSN